MGRHFWQTTNLYIPSVRIKEVVIRAGAYDINLCVSPRWNPAGDFLLHPVGGFPETIGVSKTTQVSYDDYSHYCHRTR